MILDLGFESPAFTSFTPANISQEHYSKLFVGVAPVIRTHAIKLLKDDWKIHPVAQTRGRCYFNAKLITIPTWAIDRSIEYKSWYIAHELAHAYDKCKHMHGPEFMEWLKIICPKEFIHYELGYKPRNASAAGIGKIDFDSL